MERTMKLYGNKVYGVEVSKYGLENGYLDYLTLSKIVGSCILNNYLRAETMEDFGTSWDYVLTGIKLIWKENNYEKFRKHDKERITRGYW